jgi:hypothetical protein
VAPCTPIITAPPPPPAQEPPQVSSYSVGLSSGLSGSTSMGTLSSADALVALAGLAGLAGINSDQQDESTANGQGGLSAFIRPSSHLPTSAAKNVSHGFGAGLPADTAPRRTIPSFAVIRGQVNGQEGGLKVPPATSTSNRQIATDGLSPVVPEGNGTPGTYIWPKHADTEGTT